MTVRTASAAVQATGLPPKVLNSSTSSGTAPSSSDLTTRAATGKPLPMGLPITPMWGTIPDAWGVGGLGQPVVGAGGHDRAGPPGGRAGDPPGEVVGLAAGVHDHDGVQLRRQGGLEAFGELD